MLISAGGREVIIKAVAYAIPAYTMSVFRLPDVLCKQIQTMITDYCWGELKQEKRIHLKKWSLLCLSKLNGGAVWCRDLNNFNQAVSAKQAWRVLSHPDTLVARIFKAKYFHSSKFLDASRGHNSSFAWKSVLWG
ncbi:uncharacterized mitochondrial protein AtMg00310-like [Primulina eburnea]|uniref:uncharacterized mitochondrial protein AtMg00310-like n=1 Tax=Primulina eburnea TaxID=1245227 RepID=UPI003C6C169E